MADLTKIRILAAERFDWDAVVIVAAETLIPPIPERNKNTRITGWFMR
jgi:hypothetical protein